MKNIIKKPLVNASFKFKLILLAIFLYPSILIFQGGDLTDTGFLATKYFFFFENDNNGFSVIFLTEFLGAIWMKLFPKGGIFGLRLLYLIFLWISIIINYHLLRDYTKNKLLLLLSFFVGMVYTLKNFAIVFHYDIASWTFISLANLLLLKGHKNKKDTLGFFSGLAIFVAGCCKVSSFCCFPLIILGAIFARFKIKFTLYFIIGFLFCGGFVVGIMEYNGIYNSYLESVAKLIGFLNNPKDTGLSTVHTNLISVYINSLYGSIPYLISGSILCLYLIFVGHKKKKLLYIFSVICIFIVSWYFINGKAFRVWNPYGTFSYLSPFKYMVPGLCMLPLLYAQTYKDLRAVLLFSFLISVGQVFGTNSGVFLKLSYGLMILIPLSIIVIEKSNKTKIYFLTFFSSSLINFLLCFIMFFSILSTIGFIYHVEYGIASRTKCKYVIDNPKMTYILTSKENKEKIQSISETITKKISNCNSMYIFGHQPLFYYLASKKPAIKNFWLSYNSRSIEELLKELKVVRPVIVDTKQQILGKKSQEYLIAFLKKNNYKLTEKSKFINIWEPKN